MPGNDTVVTFDKYFDGVFDIWFKNVKANVNPELDNDIT